MLWNTLVKCFNPINKRSSTLHIMLNFYLSLIFCAMVLVSCNTKAPPQETIAMAPALDTAVETPTETTKVAVVQATEIVQEAEPQQIDRREEIDFAKFSTPAIQKRIYAPINWESYPQARSFRTRIKEAYAENEVSFGGYYVLSTFGCGAGCIMGFMIDVRDGKIYDLPLGEATSCFYAEDRVVCRADSKLFIAGICKESYEAEDVFYVPFLWDEETKKFGSIKEEDFLKKTDSRNE